MKEKHPEWEVRNYFQFTFLMGELELDIKPIDICQGWTIEATIHPCKVLQCIVHRTHSLIMAVCLVDRFWRKQWIPGASLHLVAAKLTYLPEKTPVLFPISTTMYLSRELVQQQTCTFREGFKNTWWGSLGGITIILRCNCKLIEAIIILYDNIMIITIVFLYAPHSHDWILNTEFGRASQRKE